jgi:hypothetical protein
VHLRAHYQVQVCDKTVEKWITKTFSTKTAARQWRHDAYAALRARTLGASRGIDPGRGRRVRLWQRWKVSTGSPGSYLVATVRPRRL